MHLIEEKELKSYFDYMVKHSVSSEFRIFFYKTRAHALICLLLGSCSKTNKGYSYEDICSLIPTKLVSRTTVLTILQEGTSLKYFSKVLDSYDKRRQFYKLNKSSKLRIVSWTHDMKKIFSF